MWNGGTLTMGNCTVSDNSAGRLSPGGGVFNSGTATLTNCTISGNSADGGGGLFNFAPRWHYFESGRGFVYYTSGSATFNLTNTIVAGNLGRQAGAPDAWGPFLSHGHNLIGTTALNSGTGSPDVWQGSDLTNISNPLLGPLGNNGGPTQTMPLLFGSPAINAGGSGPGIPTTDQPGLARFGAPDIGASSCSAGNRSRTTWSIPPAVPSTRGPAS